MMDPLTSILKFLQDILSVPAILIGLSALVGLIALKKTFSEVLVGTFKAIMGFLILGAGAGFLVGVLNNLSPLMTSAFNINGVIPNNEAIVAIATKTFGSETALIMVFGFIVNLVLARFTPFKYLADRPPWLLYGCHACGSSWRIRNVWGAAGPGRGGPVRLH
jgi:PTS system ascorbate-specific IIC component